ncbi:AIPR family protein [Streptomyces werraensis]|uniref:AIPR family protein n=1 Tax=Streptomyces werraensis TaxID=68284 RepID=UPI001CE314A4
MSRGSIREVKQQCTLYAQRYGYKAEQLERGLEGYAAHLFAQEDGFDAILEGQDTNQVDLREFICRRKDLGVDVVLEDLIHKRMMLVQAAWRSKQGPEEDKVASFFDAPSRLASHDYTATGDEQIQDLLANLSEKIDDGYEILLRFVTNVSVSENTRLQELTEAKNRAYEEADQAITCELYGGSDLVKKDNELRSATRGGFVDRVAFHVQAGKTIELTSPFKTIIAVVKGNELADLYLRKNVGSRLFNLNIRLPLTSLKVNPKMVETAISSTEGKNFFYYNNGVSAVCSKYTLEDNTIQAERFQIINGAQTVSALAKARRKTANSDVYVLFRLTETSESYGGEFTENIIRYNNTQNPVKASDFFSNDDIQLWLRDSLPTLSGKGPLPAFYYVHKSGYKPRGATGRGLRIDQLAGIRHAFLYGPVVSYREPAQFFDRSGKYWEAFGINGHPASSWTAEELARTGAALAIHHRIQALGKSLKTDPKTKDKPEAKYLYRLARYVTGLVGAGLEAVREDTFNDYSTLIASAATFEKYVDPIVKEARSILRLEWRNLQDKKLGVQPEYNLARDEKIWVRLSDSVQESVVSSDVTF